MSDINQETLERFVATAEQLLAAMPIMQSNNYDTSTSLINMNEVVGYGDGSNPPTINHLAEIVSYEPVYEIKTNDYIIGGANGIANLQARALVGRTNYLKKAITELADKVGEGGSSGGTDDSRYESIMQQIAALDVSVFKRQISQLERQNMTSALAMKAAGMDVDESEMIVEVFNNLGVTAIDLTNAEVVVVIAGDDSVDITDAGNLIKGGIYKLTDGEISEEVQIKENLGTIENGYRILFANDVVGNYKNNRARLYRSSAAISDNKAYGGGILREKSWTPEYSFTGAASSSTLSATVNFNNGAGFELTNAVVDSNGQIVLGEEAVGITLAPRGWVRIDAEGDDLNA